MIFGAHGWLHRRLLGAAILILGAGVAMAQAKPSAAKSATAATLPPPTSTSSPVETPSGGAPVIISNRTLFEIHARLFTLTPEERAEVIAKKVKWLARQPRKQIEAIAVVAEGPVSEIVSQDTVLMTVTDSDAAIAGMARAELAQRYAQQIRTAALAIRKENSLQTTLLALLYTLLSTALLIAALWLMLRGFGRTLAALQLWHERSQRAIRIQQLELLSAARLLDLTLLATRLLRLAVAAILLYAYLAATLNFFPGTRGYASLLLRSLEQLWQAIWGAIGDSIPNLLTILVLLAAAYYAIRLAKYIFRELEKETIRIPGFYPEWADPTYKIVRFLLLVFLAVIAFPYLPGSKSPALQGVSIFLGLLLSLGSTSAVANIVAGCVLTYTRAFRVGDRVKIGDTVGDVTEKTLLVTHILTIKNVNIAIPNAIALNSHIINYSTLAADRSLILPTTVTIGYDAPWRTVHALLISAARATPDVLDEPAPFVLQSSLDDFYVSYELNAHTRKPHNMAQIYSDLHQNIQDKFNEAGMEIMSPHYGAVRDGNVIAIPEENHPQGYQAPGFRILPTGLWPGPKG